VSLRRLFSKIHWRSKWEVAKFSREVAKFGDLTTLANCLTYSITCQSACSALSQLVHKLSALEASKTGKAVR
jgi:hypothetical protein